jgi:hypothetical protein
MKSFLRRVAMTAPLVLPMLAHAQGGATTLPNAPFSDVTGALNIMCTVAGWIFAILIVLAVIFVLLAAFNYLTASGDSEKVSKANSQLIYAAIAVAVALFARGFPLLIVNFVGGSGVTSACG